jgi:hypothetical protein
MMNIAIIGTGTVGSTLGAGWTQRGHSVTFGTRDPQAEKVRTLLGSTGAAAATPPEAAASADVVVLATPWNVTVDVAGSLGDLAGKVVVDATNPIASGLQLAVGTTTSGAEQVAQQLPGARVVKAFNTTGAENMAAPIYNGEPITMFICGDDEDAKASVAGLARDLGFEAVDVGPLHAARFLEPMALVWIQLAAVQGLGRDIAFKLVRRG